MQTLHETELSYTQDHKLDLNGMARTLLEDLVNTVMVEQVEELGCVRNGYRERKLVTKQAMLRLVGAVCIDQNEEWFVATHFMDKRSLLFEECPKRESCTQETINHLLQVIDSDFKVCREVA